MTNSQLLKALQLKAAVVCQPVKVTCCNKGVMQQRDMQQPQLSPVVI